MPPLSTKHCCVGGCSNKAVVKETRLLSTYLHAFPKKQPARYTAWCNFVKLYRADVPPEKAKFICSDHFTWDDYDNILRYDYYLSQGEPAHLNLKKTAIPSIAPVPKPGKPVKPPSKASIERAKRELKRKLKEMPLIRKCCAQNCEAKQHTYAFPQDDNLRQIWVEFIRRRKPYFRPMKTSRLCFRHFHTDQFNNYYPYQQGLHKQLWLNRENDRPIPTIHIPEQGYSPLTPRQLINVTTFTPETRKKVVDAALAMEQVSSRLENKRKRRKIFTSSDRLEVPLPKQSFKVAPTTASGPLSKTIPTTFKALNTFKDITSTHHASIPDRLNFGLDHYGDEMSSLLEGDVKTEPWGRDLPNDIEIDHQSISGATARSSEAVAVNTSNSYKTLDRSVKQEPTEADNHTLSQQLIVSLVDVAAFPERSDDGVDYYGDRTTSLIEGNVKTEPRDVELDLPNDVEIDYQSISVAAAGSLAASSTAHTSDSYKMLGKPDKGATVKHKPSEADNITLSQGLLDSHGGIAVTSNRLKSSLDYYSDEPISLSERDTKTGQQDLELPNDTEVPMLRTTTQSTTSASSSTQLITRCDTDNVPPLHNTASHTSSTPRTPRALRGLQTQTIDKPQPVISTTTARRSGKAHCRTAGTNQKDIVNLYELLETHFKLEEIYTSDFNKKVANEFSTRITEVLGLTAHEARKESYRRFRNMKVVKQRSTETRAKCAKSAKKYNKLQRRLRRLPYIMSQSDINNLKLCTDLMSSDDDDTDIAHPPVWRTDYATCLFVSADKVKLKMGNAFSRNAGSLSAKPMNPHLIGNPLVKPLIQ